MPRTRRTVVILISGKAGSGKSTVAGEITKKLQKIENLTVMPYGFADPIKYIAKAYFGWDGEKDNKGRRLLQQIGFIGREYNEDLWVEHFIKQLDKRAGIYPFNFAVISDWRFPNELNFLEKNPLLDTITIRVFGRGGLQGANANDVSETSLLEVGDEVLTAPTDLDETGFYYDFQINNDCSLEELDTKIDTILSYISKQYIVE